MSSARGAAATVVELLDAVPEIDYDDPSGLQLPETSGRIAFDNVHFRYPTRPFVRVLRGLDLEVKAGQFVAIVGPSGCGKSTLIQLIEKFYNPISGTVKIDGLDIAKLNVASYRQHISLVSQEPVSTSFDHSLRMLNLESVRRLSIKDRSNSTSRSVRLDLLLRKTSSKHVETQSISSFPLSSTRR